MTGRKTDIGMYTHTIKIVTNYPCCRVAPLVVMNFLSGCHNLSEYTLENTAG